MPFRLRYTLQEHNVFHVLFHCQHGNEVVRLKDEADVVSAEVGQFITAHPR